MIYIAAAISGSDLTYDELGSDFPRNTAQEILCGCCEVLKGVSPSCSRGRGSFAAGGVAGACFFFFFERSRAEAMGKCT